MVSQHQITEALRSVKDPEIGQDLVSLNMVKDISLSGTSVTVTVNLTAAGCPMKQTMQEDITKAVGKLAGVEKVVVKFGEMSAEDKQKLAASLRQNQPDRADVFKDVTVVAVGSGKGGVGKSTLSVNLAVALQKAGKEVGILDADVLGFSVATLLGIEGKRPMALDKQTILPIPVFNIKAISMGNLIQGDKALIWRAPVIKGVLEQFFYNVRWGDLDYLIIDLPPGTGDVQLNIMQQLPNSHLLLVTTPQNAAARVSARLGSMAEKLDINILGVAENMSYFQCPGCDDKHYIFGQGQGEQIADNLNVDLLAQIPLAQDIRENSDKGAPIALSDQHPLAEHYRRLAQKIIKRTQKD